MEFSGKEIQENKIYLIMNKPRGYVCAAASDSHKTVYQLLPQNLQDLVKNAKRGSRLHTVGRLDCDTSGLLLITTDGHFSNYLTRAENQISKSYKVLLEKSVSPEEKKSYKEKALLGLTLPEDKKAPQEIAAPALIEWMSDNLAKITITEGKFHEVKRIFAALGNKVLELERLSIEELELDLDLGPGDFRPLKDFEIEGLLNKKKGKLNRSGLVSSI
ncbi:MAG: pseudouridine synthase [Treponema sp.]|nr:pseudouridine synthase [Treponema sp.]